MPNLSGTITGTTANSAISARVLWEETGTSISNNTSTVKCTLQYYRGDDLETYGSGYFSITCDGQTANDTKYLTLNAYHGWQTAMEYTFTVGHSADGTRSTTISATGYLSGTTLTSTTLSGTATLSTIPRKSSLSLSKTSITMNNSDSITLTVTRASTSFTHTITANLGASYNQTLCTKATGSSYTLKIPTTWNNGLPSANSGNGNVRIETFNGSTSLGYTDYTITCNVTSYTLSPSLTAAINSNGYSGQYIAGKTSTKLTGSCSGVYGSTITSWLIKEGSTSLSTTSTYTSGALTAGTHTYTLNITDSRGKTANTSVQITAYTAPSMSAITLGSASVDMDGTATQSATVTLSSSATIFCYDFIFTLGSESSTYSNVNTSSTTVSKTGVTFQLDWCRQLPNSTSGTCTLTVNQKAGSNGAIVATKTKTFTLKVPTTVVPTVTVAVTGVSLWNSMYIQGKSKVTITGSNIHGAYDSTIKTQKFWEENTLLSTKNASDSGSNTFTTGFLNTSGDRKMWITVIDSRGRKKEVQQTINVKPYSSPSISNFKAFRSNSSGTAQDDGTYITVQATANCSPLINDNNQTTNTATLKAASKLATDSSYSNEKTLTSGTASVLSGTYAIDNAYNVRFTITDTYGTSGVTKYLAVSSSYVGIAYDKQHKSVGINRYPGTNRGLYVDDSGLYVGNNAIRLYASSEGGNIRQYAPDGTYCEIDQYDSTHFRLYRADANDGNYKALVTIDKNTYAIDVPGNIIVNRASPSITLNGSSSSKSMEFYVAASGNRGLQDSTNSKWFFYLEDANDRAYLNRKAYINGNTEINGNVSIDGTSGSFKIGHTGGGLFFKDSTDTEYGGIYDNGANLWIGSQSTDGNHHTGKTFISSGLETATSGNPTIYVSVPSSVTSATNYSVYHAGNSLNHFYTSASNTTTIPSGTVTELGTYTPGAAGKYLIAIDNNWNASFTNTDILYLEILNSSNTVTLQRFVRNNGVDGGGSCIAYMINLSDATQKIRFRVRQDSGSNKSAKWRCSYVLLIGN